MNLDKHFFYTIKPEVLKEIWENFSKTINGKFDFKESIRANVNGPIYTYGILSKLDDYELKIHQTVYIKPGGNDQPTAQEYTLTKENFSEIHFRIWRKDFFEKLFGLNKVDSGNPDIDKNFSLKTNSRKLEELFKKNEKLRNLLTSNDYNFFIETRKGIFKMTLKRTGVVKSIKDFEYDISLLKLVLDEIK